MSNLDLTQSLAIVVLSLVLAGYGVILYRLMGIIKDIVGSLGGIIGSTAIKMAQRGKTVSDEDIKELIKDTWEKVKDEEN